MLAATQLGLTEAPVIVLGHLTEAQRRAYRIADNKLTELGGWDEALLLEELRGLMAEDFDLGLIGIPEDELDVPRTARPSTMTPPTPSRKLRPNRLRGLLNLRRAGKRAGRAAERLDARERIDAIHRQMLDAAARRPADRDALADRLRDGRF